MFICGYHFPASEGNDVAFDKVAEKVNEGTDATGKTVTVNSLVKYIYIYNSHVEYYEKRKRETRSFVSLASLSVSAVASTLTKRPLIGYFAPKVLM